MVCTAVYTYHKLAEQCKTDSADLIVYMAEITVAVSISIPGVLLVLLCGLVSSCPLFFLLEVSCRLGRIRELFMGEGGGVVGN